MVTMFSGVEHWKPTGAYAVWKIETVRWALWAAWLLGFLAAIDAFVTICGYWAGESNLQGWTGEGTAVMALNTAAAILALGIATMILSQVAMGEEHRWLHRLSKP